MERDHCVILVGNMQIGLIGLKGVFEELKNERGKPEPELKAMLTDKIGRKNYIASSVRREYEKALFREFRKFLGEKVEEEKSGFLEVTILGLGCYSCNKLEQDVMAVLSETGLQASLNHVSDPTLMSQYGNPSMPALVINGKVKSKGILPMKSVIRKWLEEEKR